MIPCEDGALYASIEGIPASGIVSEGSSLDITVNSTKEADLTLVVEGPNGTNEYTAGPSKAMVQKIDFAMTGDYKFRCGESASGSIVVGFENHSGKTRLGPALQPLGTVISGHGNNGEDGTEGAHYKNCYGSYSHGPLLPKNPEFCDHILLTALERKYGRVELAPLDDSVELAAHDFMCARV